MTVRTFLIAAGCVIAAVGLTYAILWNITRAFIRAPEHHVRLRSMGPRIDRNALREIARLENLPVWFLQLAVASRIVMIATVIVSAMIFVAGWFVSQLR